MSRLSPLPEAMRPFAAVLFGLSLCFAFTARADERPGEPDHVHVAHAIAMHGEPKYGPNFTHFDYVNPEAPKGGTIRLGARGTFDSFNEFIPKGNAGESSSVESLLGRSFDEPFTLYGLIAETIEWPEDRSWVAFTLRPEARWHDGKPITVEDVIWSLETLKTKGHPFYRFYYGSVAKAEKVGERRVKFTFTEKGNRELPLIVGELSILPKHYWEAEGRDFTKTTLDPPLGSGPYRVTDFEAGRYIVHERVKDSAEGAGDVHLAGEVTVEHVGHPGDDIQNKRGVQQPPAGGGVLLVQPQQDEKHTRQDNPPDG